jgi:hypothetical protein
MLAKACGLLGGVSDTVLILPRTSELVFVEFKTKVGVQSAVQIDFEQRVKAHGFRYELVRDFETFKKIIEND